MTPKEDLERSIRDLHVETTSALDQHILADASAVLGKARLGHFGRRRTVSMSVARTRRWIRLPATAALICLTVGGFWWLFGGLGIAGSAYAELAESIQNTKAAEWIHYKVSIAGQEGEAWMSFRPFRAFTRFAGHVIALDSLAGRRYKYDPATDTLTIVRWKSPMLEQSRSFYGALTTFLEQSKLEGKKVVKVKRLVRGKPYTIFTVELKGSRIRYTVDPSVERVVEIEARPVSGSSETSPSVRLKIDYPETGPADVYALGVPRDVKTVDHTAPREDSDWERHFKKAIETIDSRPDWPRTPEEVAKAYWTARATKNYEEMAVLWPGSGSWPKEVFQDEAPVEYVFGKADEAPRSGEVFVPYATAQYHEKHGTYNLKMRLSNKGSAKGRYYVVSGN